MNLKSAARILGVHYQTAYRWVRSGELPAVRHGDGYEVSDEAITLFVARRDARRRLGQHGLGDGGGSATAGSAASASPCLDSLIRECEDLIRVGSDTAEPALSYLARGAASLLDALVVIHVLDHGDPPDVADRLWWHANPERHALWTRVLSRPDVTPVSCLAPVLQSGRIIMVDHLSAEQTLSFIPADLAYLLDTIYPHSVLMLPLQGPCLTVGVLSIIIDRPGRLFSDDDREAAERIAGTATAAIVRARAFAHAAALRGYLHAEITRILASTTDREEATAGALAAVADARGSAFLMTPAGHFVAASQAFGVLIGRPASSLVGQRVASVADPADEPTDRRILARLWSGELDHTCTQRTRITEHGPMDVDAHWSVARWPDLQPAFIVATQSRVGVRPADWLGDPRIARLRAATGAVPFVAPAAAG